MYAFIYVFMFCIGFYFCVMGILLGLGEGLTSAKRSLKGMRYSFDCHLVAKNLLANTVIYLVIGTQHSDKKILPLVTGTEFLL
jgi:hypothetical protein